MTTFPNFIFINDQTIKKIFVDNIIRSEMESGDTKTKLKRTIPLINYSFEVSINLKDFSSFENWFIGELRSGSLGFLIRDFFTGKFLRMKFLDSNLEWIKTGNLMTATFILEGHCEF